MANTHDRSKAHTWEEEEGATSGICRRLEEKADEVMHGVLRRGQSGVHARDGSALQQGSPTPCGEFPL